jgi:hypothetical protein
VSMFCRSEPSRKNDDGCALISSSLSFPACRALKMSPTNLVLFSKRISLDRMPTAFLSLSGGLGTRCRVRKISFDFAQDGG